MYPNRCLCFKMLTFASDSDGDYDIYVMDADGSNVVQLTNNSSVPLHRMASSARRFPAKASGRTLRAGFDVHQLQVNEQNETLFKRH